MYPMLAESWLDVPPVQPVHFTGEEFPADQLRRLLNKHLPNVATSIEVQTSFSAAAHPLVEMSSKAKADILIIGTHQRHGLARLLEGSVTRGVLRESGTNLLCIPLTSSAEVAPKQAKPMALPTKPASPTLLPAVRRQLWRLKNLPFEAAFRLKSSTSLKMLFPGLVYLKPSSRTSTQVQKPDCATFATLSTPGD
jgi:hypothetical protein